ncbi:hypothetical protein TNCV_1169441 [Trichonephila clavipes]|uniref:Uncharacterized protein n=1 Tax=Trichonephila clavipes TaxID=2585209 RepID=A0A8X6VTA3_TRICX|nr:hypothetical protein TNCV_1169441 [Trichonephila clavipes]
MLEDNTIGVTHVKERLNRFKSDHTLIESDQHSGWLQISRNAAVDEIVEIFSPECPLTKICHIPLKNAIPKSVSPERGRELSLQLFGESMCHIVIELLILLLEEEQRNLKETATAGSDVVQSGRPIFDDFFQHLWPYIGNNTTNVVFQMVKRLWLIRIDQ